MELERKVGYHRHHIIPKHMGGDDTKENLVYLTPEEHAAAHLHLYEEFGYSADLMAYNYIITNWCKGRAISGYKQTPEHIRKRIAAIDYSSVSEKLKGRQSPTLGMKLGPPSEETKKKISDSLKDKPFTDEHRKNISAGMKGNIPWNKMEYYCIFCHGKIKPSRLDRHGPGKKECERNKIKE